jgi:anti-sigma factor RsiW
MVMKTKCNQFTIEQISRFVDHQLPEELEQHLEYHQKSCPDCSHLINEYKRLSILFSDHADRQVSRIPSERVTEKLAPVFNKTGENFPGMAAKLFGKNIYLKLASIVAIVVISLVAFQDGQSGPAGPSAIVKSVNTDFSSVMIIETEKQHHTIIWFSET